MTQDTLTVLRTALNGDNLYGITGNVLDINTLFINREALRTLIASLEAAVPVASVDVVDTYEGPYNFDGSKLLPRGKHLLYTHAQPVEQPSLTDKQIMNIYEDCDEGGETLEFTLAFARAIEQAIKGAA